MIGLGISRLHICLTTSKGEYGFKCDFNSSLNIIRGNNSSGKSTLINSLIYSLGMEEILGGKGEKTLPYALKEYVETEEKEKIPIVSSHVYVEIFNKEGIYATLKRSINSSQKSTKLIEVIQGRYLSYPDNPYTVSPKYLHDKGSAQNLDSGFYSYLENFIGLHLPVITGSNGGEVKLYLQTIFSALFVEQKRGWTDYIANTPYYAIREVRTRIVEFLLGMDVFENDRIKSALKLKLSKIQSEWAEERVKIRLIEEQYAISVAGVKRTPDESLDLKLVNITKDVDGLNIPLDQYIADSVKKLEAIEQFENRTNGDVSSEVLDTYNQSKMDLDFLVSMYESANSEIRLSKSRLSDYMSTKSEIEIDLEKNKIAIKLKNFGAQQDLEIARDHCPACHQNIDDSLFLADTLIQPMSIEENVKYLNSQYKMILRFIDGLNRTITKLESHLSELSDGVSDKRAVCLSLKKQIKLTGSASETDLRVKLQIEGKIEKTSKAEALVSSSLTELKLVSKEFKDLKIEASKISEHKMSIDDKQKYISFQKHFRKYANLFGYSSAPTSEIEINRDTFFPYLSGLELREVNTSIKSDSSASDFVRLIWAYLLSIFTTSEDINGNHVGLIVLDEPGQHSMAVPSVNALLKSLSEQANLQCIVAASFDESDDVFKESVKDVNFHLIECGVKLLCPIR